MSNSPTLPRGDNARDVADLGLDPEVLAILTETATATGLPTLLEHTGGGLIYVTATMPGDCYVWFGWTDEEDENLRDYGLATYPVEGAKAINGCLYGPTSETYITLRDEPIGDDGITAAAVRFIRNALAEQADPATVWQSV